MSSLVLIVAAGMLGIPVLVLLVEVISAARGERKIPARSDAGSSGRTAVIVPAHNESAGVVPTIEDIKSQLEPGDRLIVVADNCSDDTAAVAAAAGAEVIVRNDLTKIGKGYALGWAIKHVGLDPPDFVMFIDADCRMQSDGLKKLKVASRDLQRPVQALFLMQTADGSPIDHSFAEFTFLLRNLVRPLGLSNLGCPVQLMGTGMMFPWEVIRLAPLASGHLVEDLKLGLDLAAVGRAPRFWPSVKVTSDFPTTAKGTDSQRQRWVQGHLGMIWTAVPRLLVRAISRRDTELLALALDLLVPPLSLLGLLLAGAVLLTFLMAVWGVSNAPFFIAMLDLLIFVFAVSLAWYQFGRRILPARKLLSLGPQIGKKFRIFGQILLGRTAATWIRTDRGKSD